MSNGTITMTGAEYDALAGKIAALEAELTKLKGEYEWITSINTALDESNQRAWGELAKLRAGQESLLLNLADQKRQADEYRAMWAKAVASSPQPSAVSVVHGLDADDVRAACQNAVEVFAEEQHAQLCREVAEYMREVLLVDLERAAPAQVQGDGWIPVSERLPQIKQVLSEKCTLEGREIPTLYRSGMVLTFDGSRVSAGIVEWFHSKSPLNNVTHWMPLPESPAIAAARQEGGKV